MRLTLKKVQLPQQLLQIEGKDAGEVANNGNPCDMFEIPAEGDVLQPHYYYACSRAYYQHAAAYAGTVCKQEPVVTVLTIKAQVIHSHAACHKRDIINNRRQETYNHCNYIGITVRNLIQKGTETSQNPSFCQSRHRGQYTKKEEYRAEVYLMQDIHHP